MSKAAGDFSCGELVETQIKIERIWADASVQKDYQAEVTALTTLMAKQTANLSYLEDKEKDRELQIIWITDCSAASDAVCADDCTIGGRELESDCKSYALDLCFKDGFTIREKLFRTSNFSKEEVLAKAMLKAMRDMDERIARAVVALLASFAGVNQMAAQTGITPSGTDTYIEAPYWTAELMAYFSQAMVLNRMRNSFLLSGQNLYSAMWIAKMNAQNADGKGKDNMLSSIETVFDLFNIDSVLGSKSTLLVEPSSYAFASKSYYGTTPVEYAGFGQKRFSQASKNLPGVTYDFFYTNRCEANEIYHDYSLEFHGGFFENPLPCAGEMTGVLNFLCGEAP